MHATAETKFDWSKAVWAIVEVLAAFAAMHVAFRAFKRFTALGQAENQSGLNFSPGLVMIAVAFALIAMRRRSPAAFGLTPRPFWSSVNAAFLTLLILAACGGVALACGAPLERPPTSLAGSIGPVIASLVATLIVLYVLSKLGGTIERTPRAVAVTLLIGIPILPFVAAMIQERAFGREALIVLWLLVGTGIGEEVFFRGYVQSRLNEAFGRPWRLCGVKFGFGLIGAAILFGLVHVLNSADYFIGVYRFMWWHGLVAASSLFCGFLRERYGNVVAPAVVHGFGNLLVRMPRLLQGDG